MKKTFLLCIGAQKAGTSWLYSYLDSHEEVDLGFMKEYHVFDTLYSPIMVNGQEKIVNEIIDCLQSPLLHKHKPNILKRLDFLIDTKNYAEYFDYLYLKNDATKVVGDITPAYSTLTDKDYKKIKLLLESYGFNVKVIFIMRDPFERCWSSARMQIRDRIKSNHPVIPEEEKFLKSVYSNEHNTLRTRYDLIVNNLEKTFNKDDIHLALYEDLFNNDSIKKICAFLGISYKQADFSFTINTTDKNKKISESLKSEIKKYYSPSYDKAKSIFGDKIDKLW